MKNCVRPPALCLLVLCGAVSLAASADLPKAEAIKPDSVHPGQPATVVYRLSWPGSDDWRIPAPRIEQPDWGQVQLQSTTTYTAADSTVVEFAVDVIPDETGQYELPRIEFEVYAADDLVKNEKAPLKEPPAPWTTTQAVTADPITLAVTPDYRRWLPLAVGGGVAMLVLVAGGVLVLRSRPQSAAPAQPVSEDPREHVHAARKHRLDGNFYHFFLALAAAAGKLKGPDAAKLAAQHTERAREVGYGGIRPADDEMDAALKDTERLIAATRG